MTMINCWYKEECDIHHVDQMKSLNILNAIDVTVPYRPTPVTARISTDWLGCQNLYTPKLIHRIETTNHIENLEYFHPPKLQAARNTICAFFYHLGCSNHSYVIILALDSSYKLLIYVLAPITNINNSINHEIHSKMYKWIHYFLSSWLV